MNENSNPARIGLALVRQPQGRLAHAAVLEHQPDVVVMDIGLTEIDAYRVARRLREDASTRRVPLIALTGHGQLRNKEQAAVAGFDAHLTKPVAPEDVIAAIEAVVADAAQAQGSAAS